MSRAAAPAASSKSEAVHLEFNLGSRAHSDPIASKAPFRVLVIGDFSGHGARDDTAVLNPVRIDVDNFDEVLEHVAPRIEMPGSASALVFHSLEDFHPDHLFHAVPVFADIAAYAGRTPSTARLPAAPVAAESEADTLERLLGRTAPAPSERVGGIDLDALLRDAIAAHVVAVPDPNEEASRRATETTYAAAMRGLLHDPAFQHREALWRGLHRLVFGHDAGETLEIFILDVNRQGIAAEIESHRADLRNSSLYDVLVTRAHGGFGGAGYALIVCDYAFNAQRDDIELLAGLGALAAHSDALLLAAAEPALLGGTDFSSVQDPRCWEIPPGEGAVLWQALRECPQAPWLGLVMPRVIGRVPYGRRGEPIEVFDFEELRRSPAHADFLWLNGAFACAELLVAAFAARGWSMQPGDRLQLGDLPTALYDTDDGVVLKPCAETLLSDAAAAHVTGLGVMALLCHPARNVVRLARCQSIASPPTALAGRWDPVR